MPRSLPFQPGTSILEEWGCSKNENDSFFPKWHIPGEEELSFASELLDCHFQAALDDLLKICQTKTHVDAGEHVMCFSF